VLDVHDLWPDHMLAVGTMTERHPAYRLARWAIDMTYRGASSIITLTPHLETSIRKYVSDAVPVKTVYSAVDLKRLHPDIDGSSFRAKHHLGDSLLVSFIGILGTAYDCATILETAVHFVHRTDVSFVIMGTGTQKEIVQERLARGDLPNVRWIEWIDSAEIPQAWAATHIAYWALHDHPIQRGAISTKAFEAMASGVPIACAHIGVGADMVRESGSGLVVTPGDALALSQAITRLLDDRNLYGTCSQRGRQYAESNLDADKAADAYEADLMRAMQVVGK
jgi:glycosyltransferase involved in cell wall biosynthesis